MGQAEINSLEDARQHNQERAARRAEAALPARWGPVAKRITWMALVAGSFLFYYLIDKLQEALSLLK